MPPYLYSLEVEFDMDTQFFGGRIYISWMILLAEEVTRTYLSTLSFTKNFSHFGKRRKTPSATNPACLGVKEKVDREK